MRKNAFLSILPTWFLGSCTLLPFFPEEEKTGPGRTLLAALLAVSGSSRSASTDDLAGLSEEFGAAIPSSWNVYNNGTTSTSTLTQITVSNGKLQMTPQSQTLWYNATKTGALFSRTISGNFVATTSVQVRKRTNTAQEPAQTVELGGLMVRNASSAQENYVFIVLGYDENNISAEVKTTTNDASAYVGPARSSSDGELRICRIGSDFYMYVKAADGTWTAQNHPTSGQPVFPRTDLPASVEVGPNVYANQGMPDVTALFDYVRFSRPGSQSDCTR